jgi:hypothetical protein
MPNPKPGQMTTERISVRGRFFMVSRWLSCAWAAKDREATVQAVLTPVVLSRFFTDSNANPFPAEEHLGNVDQAPKLR